MLELIWSFVWDVLLWSFVLYLFIILIDLFRKTVYLIVPKEPNFIFIMCIVAFVELVKIFYNLI